MHDFFDENVLEMNLKKQIGYEIGYKTKSTISAN